MKYAFVKDGIVVEFLNAVKGFELSECFHPDILENTHEAGDEVEIGWAYTDGKFIAPDAPVETVASPKKKGK